MSELGKELDGALPEQVRVSLGSAIVLNLIHGKLDAKPTTAYLMTYSVEKCTANCGFCPQAKTSRSEAGLLSRVSWPVFPVKTVIEKIASAVDDARIRRVCIQALNYPEVFTHLAALARTIKQHVDVPISVSCQPLNRANMQLLADAGVDRIGIALDAATERLFNEVKGSGVGGPYRWENQLEHLRDASEVFGRGNISTHLIVGLGETEKEAAACIQQCVDMDVLPALFAFTPIKGTLLEKKLQPQIESYRRIQVARYLIVNGKTSYDKMRFDVDGKIVDFGIQTEILSGLVKTGQPFLTTGCLDCNRPFYNEKPRGPLYNYPRQVSSEEAAQIQQQLGF
ncbi:MAG: radical SAM protein [Candidatus Bathyarchaeota archaeon]|nr:radical SAM protein [Candidatus Bathyarchaeota archaeon]